MPIIETIKDHNNSFLKRREIVCNFNGLGGKLNKLEAAKMLSKELKIEEKSIIPILMKNDTGRQNIRGTFYVYEDENLAKKQVNPTVFQRLEKIKKKQAEATKEESKSEEGQTSEAVEEPAKTSTPKEE